jgi:hypothetical protein
MGIGRGQALGSASCVGKRRVLLDRVWGGDRRMGDDGGGGGGGRGNVSINKGVYL